MSLQSSCGRPSGRTRAVHRAGAARSSGLACRKVGAHRCPHGLRHACARHLIDAGLSFKEVGDHLGHRNPDSTRIYAKVSVELNRQRRDRLGGVVHEYVLAA